MRGLIVGGGSAGKNYLLAGVKLGHSMFLHDQDSTKSIELKQEIPNLTIVNNFAMPESSFDYIIISTTSDTHLRLATIAAAHKPKYLVVEKLLTNNLSDLDALVSLRESYPHVRFVSHDRWKLLGLNSRISRLIEQFELGKLVSFNSIGGAMCLASGAIHWLASLDEFFALYEEDFQMSGDLNFSNQKNREKFDIVNGVLQVIIGGRYIRFEYSACSKVTPVQVLLFEEGIISINFSGEYQVFRRNSSIRDSVKRYFQADLCEQGAAIFRSDNPFESLLESLGHNNYNPQNFLGSVRATELIILAMQLTQKKVLTQLDLKSMRLDPNLYKKSWRIT